MKPRRALAAALAAVLAWPMPASGVADENQALLELSGIVVEPAAPGPETLCSLRVTIANRGREAASRFVFEVRIGDRALPTYTDEIILQRIPPGESAEIELHDFWSSETGRPFPKDGKLTVEVTLREATWVRSEEKDGSEQQTPLGPVEGLPLARRLTLPEPPGAE